MNNMKHKILMTLALLLTAVTGAWAAPKFGVTEITPDMVPASWANDNSGFTRNFLPGLLDNLTVNDANPWSGMPSGDVFLIYRYTQSTGRYGYSKFSNGRETGGGAMGSKRELYYYVNNYKVYYATAYVEPDPNIIPVTPVAGQENQWEFDMPGSDVVLTPIYSVATVLGDDDTETSFASFKEAFLAAQNGDVIKLDWDVTVTSKTDLMTGKRATADPVKFTIDFNGYILDGSSAGGTFINTEHEGDEITFIDSSVDQTGGLKGMVSGVDNSFVFSSGRYNFNDGTAADIESLWTTLLVPNGWAMADGKEFVDIENAPDANGFMVRVDYKAIELTIDAGGFETFYSDQDVVLADGTPAGIELYTIKSINADLSTATLSDPLTDIIVAGTPILVYNGTANEQTVTIKVTTEQPFNALMWAGAFQGTAVDKEFTEDDMEDYDYYALSGGKAFVKVRGAGILGAHQCYLEIPKQQSAGSKARGITIVFDDDEATRINEVIEVNGVNDDTWYDLSGRRVTKPTKGVFIKNGKKVVK